MDEKEQIAHFEEELRRLVDRFRSEYELSYAAAIGVLTLQIHRLCKEGEEE